MVKERESLTRVGSALAQEVINGRGGGTKAFDLAMRLEKLCAGRGRYEKRYETHEERVLHRHLNLYKNKMAKARTDEDKLHWHSKVILKQREIDALKVEHDLEGL